MTDQQMPAMETGSKKLVKGDVLMKLRKERKGSDHREMSRRQSANFQQLAKLKELMKEAGVPGDCNSKCKSKLSTDACEKGISMAFL